jgi:hypothetical protein
MQDLKIMVLELLTNTASGRTNPITSMYMAKRFQVRESLVRKVIAELIAAGHPIASVVRHPPGYFIPNTRGEAEECLQHLRSRTREIYLRSKNLEKALVTKFGSDQLSLGIELREIAAR